MNNEKSQDKSSIGVGAHSLSYSEGLRIYMLSVYNYMALGLGFTGSVALLVVSSPALLDAIMPMMLFFIIAPVALVLFFELSN